MNFKKGDYILFVPQTHGNTGKKIIIFFAIMKPLSGVLKNTNQNKKGAYYHGKQKHSSG